MKTGAKKLVIGFDMDGVILNNSVIKLKTARNMGIKVRPSQTPSEIIKKFFDKESYEKFKNTMYDSEKADIPPIMPGAKSILSTLKRENIPFFLISRRKDPKIPRIILKKHKLWPQYFNESNAFFVIDPIDKNIKAAKLGITHYIDDELKIIKVLSSVPNKFLFDQFNVFEKSNDYKKIKNWSQFKKLI